MAALAVAEVLTVRVRVRVRGRGLFQICSPDSGSGIRVRVFGCSGVRGLGVRGFAGPGSRV